VSGSSSAETTVVLSGDTVVLRRWSRVDATFMSVASEDPQIRRYNMAHDREGRPARPMSPAEAESVIERFERTWQEFRAGGTPADVVFAITDATSGALVGCCGVDDWSKEDVAQIGYWIAPGARGRGYATHAVVLLTCWLFDLGAARVFMTIVAGNEASVAVARRTRFQYEGTMRSAAVWQGQRCDVMLFGALPDEWPNPRRSHQGESPK
jgi:RimJ/RimL family protein N-acetyltransferase